MVVSTSVDEQQQRTDDGGVGGQRFFGLNGIEASSDGALAPCVFRSTRAHVPAGLEQSFRRTRALPERSDEYQGLTGVRWRRVSPIEAPCSGGSTARRV